jgi:hypothetical protein
MDVRSRKLTFAILCRCSFEQGARYKVICKLLLHCETISIDRVVFDMRHDD